MLQQQQTAMKAAAEQVEGNIEGSPQALRRSKRLAGKDQEEKMLAELTLTEKPTVEADVPSDLQIVATKIPIEEDAKSTGLDASVRPKQMKAQKSKKVQFSGSAGPEQNEGQHSLLKELAPEDKRPLRRSARISRRETQNSDMPVGAASGDLSDSTMEELNLTEKVKELLFGDINSIVSCVKQKLEKQKNKDQLRMLNLLRDRRSFHKKE
jgi:hypothetical protein